MGKRLGEVGKSGVLEHKSGNISETHKDRGKVTVEGLQELTNALSNGTIPDPLWPPLPQDRVHYYLRNGYKATDFKFGQYIHRVHPNKSPFGEKSVGVSRDCPIFGVCPIISGTGKATKFKFCCTFIGSIGTKAH